MKKIPDNVKADVLRIVSDFNNRMLSESNAENYTAWFKGRYLYLDRSGTDFEMPCPVCRLTYTGDPSNWEFAIYKYSCEDYDPEEWMFPGAEYVNGTIEGALEAGMKAYP